MSSMSEEEFVERMLALFGSVSEMTTLGRMGEVLKFAQRDTGNLLESIQRIAEVDDTVAPELLTALEHLGEVSEALNRAAQFVLTRYEVSEEKLRGEREDDHA